MSRPLRILSLGAGVQSTTVLLMSLRGELPPLDHAIFADTGWEPRDVYDHLELLKTECEHAGLPLTTVSVGNIRDDHMDPQSPHLFIRKPKKRPDWEGKQRTFIPFYVINKATGDREFFKGSETKGRTFRTCTKTYKIEPVEREIRNILGLPYRSRWPLEHTVDQVFGISWDEVQRMSDPARPCMKHVYPLVDLRMTRTDCHMKLAEYGWTAPRSACIGCPFHRNVEWRKLRDEYPVEWKDAVEFDHGMRRKQAAGDLPIEGMPFIHDSRVPLDEAQIDEPENPQMELFSCDDAGYCGL